MLKPVRFWIEMMEEEKEKGSPRCPHVKPRDGDRHWKGNNSYVPLLLQLSQPHASFSIDGKDRVCRLIAAVDRTNGGNGGIACVLLLPSLPLETALSG